MNYREERERIRDSLSPESIVKIMEKLGATRHLDAGNYIRFPSICHNLKEEDASETLNLSYYKDTRRFYCFSHCGSMDIFTLLRKRLELVGSGEDTHFSSLVMWIMNTGLVEISTFDPIFESAINPEDYKNKTLEIPLKTFSETVLELYKPYYPIEWLRDGISKEAMDYYGILFSQQDNAIIIPHYDVHGHLVGIRRRALTPEDASKKGKYRPIYVGNQSYAHPIGYNIYGLNKIRDEVQRQGRIFLAEGEKGALQGRSYYGDRNVVGAVCGHNLNRWQVHLIMEYCKPREIILAFDQGIPYEDQHAICQRYNGYTNFSFIYDANGLLKEKESPLDRPDILGDLIDRRIKVK